MFELISTLFDVFVDAAKAAFEAIVGAIKGGK
ncbi:Uncharacterised protein [Corynebacterium urealyticum]|nr:Uncharacterised protein [Corynebacterium urealyticum]